MPSPYALVTLHRPSNVDDLPWLRELLAMLADLSAKLGIVFPVHPRTRQRLAGSRLLRLPDASRLRLLEPLPYLEFLALQRQCHDGDHRLRRNSGGNNVPRRPLPHRA